MSDECKASVLIVDDELLKRSVLEDELSAAGFGVATAANPLEAASVLEGRSFDVVVTDLRMPGQDGLSFLRGLKSHRPEQAVIVMTAYGSVDTAVEAMKLGAFDYLQKPFTTEELLLKLDKLLNYEQLARENESLRQQLATTVDTHIVAESEAMRQVLARIHAVAGTDATVLIQGETGTGKELLARAIHECSPRSGGPFVGVSCAALPADLVESELFGHEAGAFTGAVKRRMGRIELANGGTLFLDDVDDIPMSVQVKLLRVLQERTLERLGGETCIPVNIRVIAAAKEDLMGLVAAGRFRDDLYYRLSVVPVEVPPLRDRPEDVPPLIAHFMERIAVKRNVGEASITPAAIARLQAYSWPGNVRELEHIVDRMITLSRNGQLDVDDVPELAPHDHSGRAVSLALDEVDSLDMAEVMADVEARIVRWALQRSGGNLARAAEMLNLPRSTLQYKAAKLDSNHSR